MTTRFRALATAAAPLRSSSSTLGSWGAFMRCGKILRFRGCWITVRCWCSIGGECCTISRRF
jgi:hypothetical protein